MVPMYDKERTFDNIKEACLHHLKLIDMYDCDIFTGKRGPSFFLVSQITNWKVLHIWFVQADIEKFLKNRIIGHHSRISSMSCFIQFSIIRPLQPPIAKTSAHKNDTDIPSSNMTGMALPATSSIPKSVSLSDMIKRGTLVPPKHEHDIVSMDLEACGAENAC